MSDVTCKPKKTKAESQSRPRTMADTFIPACLDDARLSAAQFRVFCHVKRRGYCYESVPAMAEVCCLDKKTVTSALKALTEIGFLLKTPRHGDTSVYKVNPAVGVGYQTGEEVGVSNGLGDQGCQTGDKGPPSVKVLPKKVKRLKETGSANPSSTMFDDLRSETVTESEPLPDLEAVTDSERSSVPRPPAAPRRPASVAEVIQFALTRKREGAPYCVTSELDAWLTSADLSVPARDLLDEQEDDVRETLHIAFRFIHYNNLRGWPLTNDWRSAFTGFVEMLLPRLESGQEATPDVPLDWVPHIAGRDGWPEEEESNEIPF
jgi:hypothetical protein